MKSYFLLIIFLCSFLVCYSQESARNTVFLEAGGATILGSINYERLFLLKNNNYALGLRGGFTYIDFLYNGTEKYYGMPVGASLIINGKRLSFETGPGFSILLDEWGFSLEPPNSRKDIMLITGLRMGIRQQPVHSGVFWNVLFQPTLTFWKSLRRPDGNADKYYQASYFPWISLGIGYSF